MDRQYINDQHIVARYLADKLSDSEREAFEAFCAQNPEVYRELEAAARLKAGLAKLAESGELEAVLEKPPGFGSFVWRHAASLAGIGVGVALLLGGVYAMRVPTLGANVAEVSGRFRSALPVAAEYELMRMRDSSEIDLRVKLPAEPAAIHIRVLPDVEDSPGYFASLIHVTETRTETRIGTTGRLVAHADELRADDRHFVSLFVNSTKLVPGTYELIVVPKGPTGQGAQSNFRIAVER